MKKIEDLVSVGIFEEVINGEFLEYPTLKNNVFTFKAGYDWQGDNEECFYEDINIFELAEKFKDWAWNKYKIFIQAELDYVKKDKKYYKFILKNERGDIIRGVQETNFESELEAIFKASLLLSKQTF